MRDKRILLPMETRARTGLRFRLLGPLEVLRDGEPLPLGGERQRGLLALLLLHANELVTTEHLAEQLFGADASEASIRAVRVAVSRLRRLLDDETVATGPGGYLLRADPDQLDIAEFEALVAEGRVALSGGDAAAAGGSFRSALALFRGRPLTDLALIEFVQPEVRRLEDLRLSALMDRIDVDLVLGSGSELVPELETLVQANPFQERLRGQLMLALYRSGRQNDALEVYRRTRELLAGELGLEPSRALQQLQQSILRQDESLELAPRVEIPDSTARRSRWPLAVAAAVLVVSGALAVPLALSDGARPPAKPRRPARILASLDLPQPSCCGFGFNAAWGVGHHDDILRSIDPHTSHVLGQWPVADFQSGVPLAAAGSVWIPSAAGGLVRFDPARRKVVARFPIQGAKIAGVSAPAAGETAIDVGGVIFPGLIDLHNHLTWNVMPDWQAPVLPKPGSSVMVPVRLRRWPISTPISPSVPTTTGRGPLASGTSKLATANNVMEVMMVRPSPNACAMRPANSAPTSAPGPLAAKIRPCSAGSRPSWRVMYST